MLTVDHVTWPERGRVGICRGGSPAGQHIYLLKAYPWLLYLEEPVDTYQVDGMELELQGDNSLLYEELAAELAGAWEVQWLEGDQEARTERAVFGVRRQVDAQARRALRSARRADRLSELRGCEPWRASLDDTERTIARRVGRGASDAEIAARLFLAEETVDRYVRRSIEKLALPDRSALQRRVGGGGGNG